MTPEHIFYMNINVSEIEEDLYYNNRQGDMMEVIDSPVFNAPVSEKFIRLPSSQSNSRTGTTFEQEEN